MKKALFILLLLVSKQVFAQNPTMYEIYPGILGSDPHRLTVFNNKLYFTAYDGLIGLYVTDGNSFPTRVYNYAQMGSQYFYEQMGVANGKLFFSARVGLNDSLLSYDGVSNFTRELPTGAQYPLTANNKLYFSGREPATGNELWVYDPVTKIGKRLTDLASGGQTSEIYFLTLFKNKVYFHGSDFLTRELWECDPATDKVTKVSSIGTPGAHADPHFLVATNDSLYFCATKASSQQLFSYGGSGVPKQLTSFAKGSFGVAESWITNNNAVSFESAARYFNGCIYFSAGDVYHIYHVYKYEIATGITSLAFKINASGNSNPDFYTVYNNKLYFQADDGVHGSELWSYDGVNSPTMVVDVNSTADGYPRNLTVFNNMLFFSASTSATGRELYKYYEAATSVTSLGFNGTISIFPNPTEKGAKLSLELKSTATLTISITDITGKNVYRVPEAVYTASSQVIDLPIDNVNAGSYCYRVEDKNGALIATGKIVKN